MTSLFEDGLRDTYRGLLSNRKLMHADSKLKTLRDSCLQCIASNLKGIIRPGQFLAAVHKELILERLAFHDMFTEAYLPHVTYNIFSFLLKRIYLYKCDQITDQWLERLADTKCTLKYLTIHNCPNVKDAGIKHITLEQSWLIELELCKLDITKKAVIHIKSRHLIRVNFRGCSKLDNTGVETVVMNNPGIRDLNVAFCMKLTESVFPIIAQHLGHNLEYFDAADVFTISDVCVLQFSKHCSNLKGLNLNGCRKLTQSMIIPLLTNCSSLEMLDLSFCNLLVGLPTWSQLLMGSLPSTLQELTLAGLQLEDGDLLLSAIERMSNLTKLNLSGVPAVTDDSLTKIMQLVGARLTHFDMRGSIMCELTDNGLKSISTYCERLEMLGISVIRNITGISLLPLLEDLKRAPILQSLMISLKNIDASVMSAVVQNCYNLQHLDVAGNTSINDEILQQLATNCSHLKHVNLKGCKSVTNVGVTSLARYCPLCVLVLSGVNSITDHSLMTLAQHCPYLEELYISGCDKISHSAIEHLKSVCIPRLLVVHRLPGAYNIYH